MITKLELPIPDERSSTENARHFLGLLLLQLNATIVVEAGTYTGRFAIQTGATLLDMGGPRMLYTADILDFGWRKVAARNGLGGHISFVQDDFAAIATYFPAIVGAVDFAWVDSGPPCLLSGQQEGIRLTHYRVAQSWMRPGGIVAVDDMKKYQDWGGEEIWAERHLYLPDGHGITLWQKP
jgi:hypothetical protein